MVKAIKGFGQVKKNFYDMPPLIPRSYNVSLYFEERCLSGSRRDETMLMSRENTVSNEVISELGKNGFFKNA